MISELLLLSGNDIPFQEAQLSIHQPTIKEIGYIGEEAFFIGSDLLNFSKDNLSFEDKTSLGNKTNFDVFMSIMKDKSSVHVQKNKICAFMLLAILFPGYSINLLSDKIEFKKDEEVRYIENKSYESFKAILRDMFCLERRGADDQNYNPQGAQARAIAEKLRKGREKAAESKGEQKIAVLSRYLSILTVGEKKNYQDLLQYTVYQLYDEFDRFELKQAFDLNMKMRLAGAKDVEEVDNWMKDIHS